jgi:hypothetical protein
VNTNVSELQIGTALEISASISTTTATAAAASAPRHLYERHLTQPTGGPEQRDIGDRAALVERERENELPRTDTQSHM